MDVQWYPGHMTKTVRQMQEDVRLVDIVIEILDARVPVSSRNPDIDVICVISSGSDFCCRREDAAAAGKLSCSSSVKRKHRERLEQGSSS